MPQPGQVGGFKDGGVDDGLSDGTLDIVGSLNKGGSAIRLSATNAQDKAFVGGRRQYAVSTNLAIEQASR